MSLITSSRREFLARTIATGVGGTVFSTFRGNAATEATLGDPVRLRKDIFDFHERIAEQPNLSRDWLSRSESERATKNEFDSGVHGWWANDWVVRNEFNRFLQLTTRFETSSTVWTGVAFHPWMHIDGYAPNRTLNVIEMEALQNQKYFNETAALYFDGRLLFAPFPDTPRLAVRQIHIDAFSKIVRRQNLNPDDYRIHYNRYYVLAGRRGTQVKPIPVLAQAFTLRSVSEDNLKKECRIVFTTVL